MNESSFKKGVLGILLILVASPLFSQGFTPSSHQISWGSDPISSGVSITSNFTGVDDAFKTLTFSGAAWTGGQRVFLMLGDRVFPGVVFRGLIGEFQNLPQAAVRLEIAPLDWIEFWGWPFISWGHIDGPTSGVYYLYGSVLSFIYINELIPMGDNNELTFMASFQEGQALPEDTYTVGLKYGRWIRNSDYKVFGVVTYDITTETMLYKMEIQKVIP